MTLLLLSDNESRKRFPLNKADRGHGGDNRIGTEGPLEFFGSSFFSDPYGRVIVAAPRDAPAVLVADLDLDQRRDWTAWGLFQTRRPDQYRRLVEEIGPSGPEPPPGR